MKLAAIRRKRDGKLAGLAHYLDYDDSYNINYDNNDFSRNGLIYYYEGYLIHCENKPAITHKNGTKCC